MKSNGIDHFNAGRFFEAHEDFEIIWKNLPSGSTRSFFHALIFICASAILIEKGRKDAAEKVFGRFQEEWSKSQSDSQSMTLIGVEKLTVMNLEIIRSLKLKLK